MEDIEQYSFRLIENLIEDVTFDENQPVHQSEKFLIDLEKEALKKECKSTYFIANEDNYFVPSYMVLTNAYFSIDGGIELLNDYIKNTFEYDKCWLYDVKFKSKVDKEFVTLYNFEVRWSIPTRQKPIPRFTASIYFTFEVSKLQKHENQRVRLYLVYETQNQVYKVFDENQTTNERFRQQWLLDIINLKETLISRCKF